MKAYNLMVLTDNRINVPDFKVIDSIADLDEIEYWLDINKKYAVRSSCVAEDTERESHAGEFDSFLNVSKDNIKEKVQRVIDAYNGQKGEVIIQEMVDSDISGVIFTANPVGILNEIVIVAGKGLGENIVEDKVDTTTYYYNIDDKLYYTEDEDILTNSQINKLVKLSLQIKEIFHKHIDIEFAIKDTEIYILQARPITTIDNDADVIILDNSNIVESYPGISLPMTQYFAKEIYYKVFKSLILRLTKSKKLVSKMEPQLKDMVDICNSRLYYRITNWYEVLNLLPFSGKVIPIWQSMLGVTNTKVVTKNKISIWTKARVTISTLNLVITSPRKMRKLNKWFKNKLGEYRKLVDKSQSIEELVNIYNKLMTDLTNVWDITLVNDMYTFIFTALSGEKRKEQIASIKNLESMKPVIELNKLVKIYKEQVDKNEDNLSAEFLIKEKEYIELYGDRCLEELKLETKTYRTHPELLREYIEKADILELEEKSKQAKSWGFIKRAKTGIYNREISRLNRSRIFGLAREIILKIGKNMVAENKIQSVNDVFYLKIEEVTQTKDFKDIIQYRKNQIECDKTLPNFSRLEFTDKIIDKAVVNAKARLVEQVNEIKGIASSVGKVKGEVIVITEPSTNIDTTGKIIVTKTTDPGWVFLIKNCLGIIAEKGSILSHTAIITRELGKPSIVNVKDITQILQTGDIIELDAYTGIIRKIDLRGKRDANIK